MEEILKQRFKELNDEDLQEVEPLIILDGVVTGTNLGGINPNSIEKIEVLKDAASAAIYGARGANGVILVETNNN